MNRTVVVTFALQLLCYLILVAAVTASPGKGAVEEADPLFASVNGTEISLQEYVQTLQGTARTTFYHGRPKEAEYDAFRIDVGQKLIDEVLMNHEARRRGIEPDSAWVEQRLAELARRYEADPRWQEREAEIVAALRKRLERQSRVDQLEKQIQELPPPSEEQLRAYYESHTELFTSPDQRRAALILLRVDPSAERETWEAARDEAARLREKLLKGADFAELARLHSQDPSADEGGDLGMLHRGMLGSMAETALDSLEVGEVSEPVQLLEGVGLFRLEQRLPGELSPLETVRERATGLWLRDEKERVRERLIASLRAQAEIEIHDGAYLELVARQSGAKPGQPAANGGSQADERLGTD